MSQLRKFVLRFALFSAPSLVVLMIALVVILASREFYYNVDRVSVLNGKFLIGHAYSDRITRYLKFKTITEHEKFNVISIGTSRVLQFREEMFEKRFYNAGYTTSSIADFEKFIRTLPPQKYPDYLIIGMDPWIFNEDVGDSSRTSAYWSINPTDTFRPKWQDFKNILTDIVSGKITFNNLRTKHAYPTFGLNALINSDGFRHDGSRSSSVVKISKLLEGDSELLASYDKLITDGLKKQQWTFHEGKDVNPGAILILEHFLSFCKRNNIYVIGILTPNSDKAQKLIINSGHYDYLKQIEPEVRPLFEKYNFDFLYCPSVSYCGSDDSETLDGRHGGEVTYLKMLIKMLHEGSALNKVCNLERLEKDLKNAKNRYTVYDY